MPKREYAVRKPGELHEPWTDAREDDVRRLWREGKSAAEIAKAIGGTSRSAVLGIVHRRGWALRGASALTTAVASGARSARRVILTPPPKLPPPVFTGCLHIDIMALTLTTCRFVTDTTRWAPRYCGLTCDEGQAYCDHHRRACTVAVGALPSLPRAVRGGRDEGW